MPKHQQSIHFKQARWRFSSPDEAAKVRICSSVCFCSVMTLSSCPIRARRRYHSRSYCNAKTARSALVSIEFRNQFPLYPLEPARRRPGGCFAFQEPVRLGKCSGIPTSRFRMLADRYHDIMCLWFHLLWNKSSKCRVRILIGL